MERMRTNRLRNTVAAGAIAVTASLGLGSFAPLTDVFGSRTAAAESRGSCLSDASVTAVKRSVYNLLAGKAVHIRRAAKVPDNQEAEIYVKIDVDADGRITGANGVLKWKDGRKALSVKDMGLERLLSKSINSQGECRIDVFYKVAKID
ncbi:MAG: hypothetical protein V1827_05720 [Candidatus Micrarchaeota archaeon]